jgi:hypothetical protein
MPRWSRVFRREGNIRRTATVLLVQGFCPACGRELREVKGERVGVVSGRCQQHGDIADALTA